MNKRLLSLFLIVMMVLTIVPTFTATASAEDIVGAVTLLVNKDCVNESASRADQAAFKSIKNALAKANKGDTIKLMSNTNENVIIDSGKEIILDLNGYVLKADSGSVVTVKGKLTLRDSSPNVEHHFTPFTDQIQGQSNLLCRKYQWKWDETGSETICGGIITGGTGTSYSYGEAGYGGGGIFVSGSGAQFIMEGGNIAGNRATDGAGGIEVENNSSAEIRGGTIQHNSGWLKCGGLRISKATVTMTGGRIEYNSCSYCGGVALPGTDYGGGGGTFILKGGTIANNYACENGGGVNAAKNSKFEMTGGTIENNEAGVNGGGVQVHESSSKITGGIIRNNKAAKGGGLYCNGSLTLGGTAVIKDNTNSDGSSRNNVYLNGGKTIAISSETAPSTMCVGVTLTNVTGDFISNASSSAVKYFFSDNEKYDVEHVNNHIALITAPLRITANSNSKFYDGTALSDSGFTSNAGGVLSSGHALTVTVAGVITDAGEVENVIKEYKITSGGSIDVTSQYNNVSTISGILHISPAAVTMTSASDSKDYDGAPLTNSSVGAVGFVNGQGATYQVTGSQTEIGSSYNTFTYTLNPNTKSSNYIITTQAGVLTVTAVSKSSDASVYYVSLKTDSEKDNKELNGYKDCKRDNTCPIYQYEDLLLDEWYHDGVHFSVENGYMNGYSASIFAPQDSLSRAMVVRILYNLEGQPAAKSVSGFSDVADTLWYSDAIAWANESNIVEGFSNGLFGPNLPVTREQLAKIYYKYSEYKGYDIEANEEIQSFTDSELVSNWALSSIKWAKAVKLMAGKGNGVLDPRGNATRAEAATMLKNFCVIVGK